MKPVIPVSPRPVPGSRQVLHSRVIGQNEAVTAVAKAVRRARAGLRLGEIDLLVGLFTAVVW